MPEETADSITIPTGPEGRAEDDPMKRDSMKDPPGAEQTAESAPIVLTWPDLLLLTAMALSAVFQFWRFNG